MTKYKVVPTIDLEVKPHTWTKGLDYELEEKGNFFTLASNEGQINYSNTIKEDVLRRFERIESSIMTVPVRDKR